MKRATPAWSGVAAAAVIIIALVFAVPASAGPHGHAGGGHSAGSPHVASGVGHAVPKSGGSSGTSTPAPPAAATTGSGSTPSNPVNGATTVGHAVPRTPATGGGTTVVVPNGYYGGFYPWGYAGLGFGGYYAGYYSPWSYGAYDGGYQSTPYSYGVNGSLRFKVKPRDATVYVDGYYVGIVDDFDGAFQRLRVEAGPHHVEVRADGYEPLAFDVQIEPRRTITYTGDLKKAP